MKEYLMKCGHVSNAITGEGNPACAICGCQNIDREVSNTEGLEGRFAVCDECRKTKVPSRWGLPFFEYRPDRDTDKFYCGCWGWD